MSAASLDPATAYGDWLRSKEHADGPLGERSRAWIAAGEPASWVDVKIPPAPARPVRSRAKAPTPSSPAHGLPRGRYATETRGALAFYRVDVDGRIARQRGDAFERLLVRERDLVAAIILADPGAAMIRYGREIGSCGVCGRTLTNATSREVGIGPVCAGVGIWPFPDAPAVKGRAHRAA